MSLTHQLKRLQPKLHFGLQTVQLSFEIIVRLTDIQLALIQSQVFYIHFEK